MTPSQGLLLVISSPSGAGKTTVCRRLLDADPQLALSVSATTRLPRPGEVDGRDYFFLSPEVFEDQANAGEFLEHVFAFGHRYGTPRTPLDAHLKQGRDVLLDVDWQGGRAISHRSHAPVVRIFILPPSLTELERRLNARATDTQTVIQSRMQKACSEAQHWAEYDYVVVNEDLDTTVATLCAIRRAEHARRQHQPHLYDWTRVFESEV